MALNEDKKTIDYEQFVAGAIEKFGSIDGVDFSLLVEDFTKKLNVSLEGVWYHSRNNLTKYLETEDNGTIHLKDGLALNSILKGQDCVLMEKLLEIAGEEVIDYFDNLDIRAYLSAKEKGLSEYKARLLMAARVLLISDYQEDYDALIKYGFRDVDYFKSIIRANRYFAEHPQELRKYHIILYGNQNVLNCDHDPIDLDEKVNELWKHNSILHTELHRYDSSKKTEFYAYLADYQNHRRLNVHEYSYQAVFDRIIEAAFINKLLEKAKVASGPFVPITDSVNPKTLPTPTEKAGLRILYLNHNGNEEYLNKIAEQLGLTIQFVRENNESLGQNVINDLGNWDIIIGSKIYSRDLLGMNIESTEQCKDTGRRLTLLMIDECLHYWYQDEIGEGNKLTYVFGGSAALDDESHEKQYGFLVHKEEFGKDEDLLESDLVELSTARSIIESAVSIYNEALLQAKLPAISDLDFRTAEDFNQEYLNVYTVEKAAREADLAAISAFDEIKSEVLCYLDFLKKRLINGPLEGLKIIPSEKGVRVESFYGDVYNQRVLCSIEFPYETPRGEIRIFEIQTESKKGRLTPPQAVGLYTKHFRYLYNVPKPTDAQAHALDALLKKVKFYLKPLNDEAYQRKESFSKNRKKDEA